MADSRARVGVRRRRTGGCSISGAALARTRRSQPRIRRSTVSWLAGDRSRKINAPTPSNKVNPPRKVTSGCMNAIANTVSSTRKICRIFKEACPVATGQEEAGDASVRISLRTRITVQLSSGWRCCWRMVVANSASNSSSSSSSGRCGCVNSAGQRWINACG